MKKFILATILILTLLLSACGTVEFEQKLYKDGTFDLTIRVTSDNEMFASMVEEGLGDMEGATAREIEGGIEYSYERVDLSSNNIDADFSEIWGIEKEYKFPNQYITLKFNNDIEETTEEDLFGISPKIYYTIDPFGTITETNGLYSEDQSKVKFDLMKNKEYYVTFKYFCLIPAWCGADAIPEREASEEGFDLGLDDSAFEDDLFADDFFDYEELNNDLVIVNGETITQDDLDAQWAALPQSAKLELSKDELLDQLVDEKILLQEAETQGIYVSDSDVEDFLELQLEQTGTTEEQFEAILEQQGTSLSEIKEVYRNQLQIAELFENAIGEDPIITGKDISDYYEQNKDQFYRTNQVTVRHILVEDTNPDKSIIVDEIQTSLSENSNNNFCQLVTEHSADTASIQDCGEYTFGRGVMVPNFETASFDMEIDEVRAVESEFGTHIIIKDAEIPAGYALVSDVLNDYPNKPTVGEVIEQALLQEKARDVFDDYVSSLKSEANIEYLQNN